MFLTLGLATAVPAAALPFEAELRLQVAVAAPLTIGGAGAASVANGEFDLEGGEISGFASQPITGQPLFSGLRMRASNGAGFLRAGGGPAGDFGGAVPLIGTLTLTHGIFGFPEFFLYDLGPIGVPGRTAMDGQPNFR